MQKWMLNNGFYTGWERASKWNMHGYMDSDLWYRLSWQKKRYKYFHSSNTSEKHASDTLHINLIEVSISHQSRFQIASFQKKEEEKNFVKKSVEDGEEEGEAL